MNCPKGIAIPLTRMLAAHSLEENLPLISRDPLFKLYQVNTIW
jgi:PIN domain nuclease of toxin-antitoxin system